VCVCVCVCVCLWHNMCPTAMGLHRCVYAHFTCTCAWKLCECVCVCVYGTSCAPRLWGCKGVYMLILHVLMCGNIILVRLSIVWVCAHVYTYTAMELGMCMLCVCVHISIYMCVCVCMYIYIYIYIYIWIAWIKACHMLLQSHTFTHVLIHTYIIHTYTGPLELPATHGSPTSRHVARTSARIHGRCIPAPSYGWWLPARWSIWRGNASRFAGKLYESAGVGTCSWDEPVSVSYRCVYVHACIHTYIHTCIHSC
jgi:hypothetical protein